MTGRGQDGTSALFDVGLSCLNYQEHWYLNSGLSTERLPRSAHPAGTPRRSYRTADGWICLMCNKEKSWPALRRKIGRPQLAGYRRFRPPGRQGRADRPAR